jgi:hypothetical protein
MNLYWSPTANGGDGCFNGYERIFVSSGTGVFGEDTLSDDWLQFWYSTNNGESYNWINTPPESCNGDDAAALIDYSNGGQCSLPIFSFPTSSIAWVEPAAWTRSGGVDGACVLIQNSPNISQYEVPEAVWNNNDTTEFDVPYTALTTCTG